MQLWQGVSIKINAGSGRDVTCASFRTHSISEIRFFRETNYDAGRFCEKIRFHSHKNKTQFSLQRIVIEDRV